MAQNPATGTRARSALRLTQFSDEPQGLRASDQLQSPVSDTGDALDAEAAKERDAARRAWQAMRGDLNERVAQQTVLENAQARVLALQREVERQQRDIQARDQELVSTRRWGLAGTGVAVLSAMALWTWERRKLQAGAANGSAAVQGALPSAQTGSALGTTTLATDSGFESELMATPSRLVEAPAVPSNSPDTGSQPLTEIGAGASPTDWFEPVPITPVSGQTVLEHLCIYRFAIEEMRKGDRAPEAAQSVRAHIDTAPHVTRWAYLEYLDILAASKKRNDFEAVRQRFRNRFNQMGPYWMESREEDKGLKPEALAEVAALWPGAGVRALLTHWLLGDEASSRHAFSLACYDDIFTLYELHSVLDQPDTAAGYLSTGAGGL